MEVRIEEILRKTLLQTLGDNELASYRARVW